MVEANHPLRELSQDQLQHRRNAILGLLGLSYKEYVLKEMNDGLTDAEKEFEEELEAIDFLLDE